MSLAHWRKMTMMLAGISAIALLAGCGENTTTTVVESTPPPQTVTEAAPTPVKKATPAEPKAQEPPPDVVGLTLPTAENKLKAAGYKADVSNTDTTFGIINPANYTVCTEDDPVGDKVPILAQKYGC